MPNAYLQGIQGAFDNQAQIRNDIAVVAINWFLNRCPLVTRTPRLPCGSTTFTMVSRSFRTRTAQLDVDAGSAINAARITSTIQMPVNANFLSRTCIMEEA